MRPGAKFHNDDEITAENVAFSFGTERMFGDTQPTHWNTLSFNYAIGGSGSGKQRPSKVGAVFDVVLCHTLDHLCSRHAVAERLLHDLHAKGIEVWAADPGVQIKTNALIEYYDNDQGSMFGHGNPITPMPDAIYEAEHLAPLSYGYGYTGAFNADRQYIFGFRKVDADAANAVQQIFRLYAEGISVDLGYPAATISTSCRHFRSSPRTFGTG